MSFWENKIFSKFFDFFVNPIRVPPVKTQKSTSFLRKTNMTVPCVKEFPIECISWYDIWVKIADLYKMVQIYKYINKPTRLLQLLAQQAELIPNFFTWYSLPKIVHIKLKNGCLCNLSSFNAKIVQSISFSIYNF